MFLSPRSGEVPARPESPLLQGEGEATVTSLLLGGGVLAGAASSARTLLSQYELFSLPGLAQGLLCAGLSPVSCLLVSSHLLSQLPSLLLRLRLL